MTIETQPGEVTWGLRLPPGVAHALFGIPVHELTDRQVELSELDPSAGPPGRDFDNDPPAALEEVFRALWVRTNPDRSRLRLASSLDRAARDGLTVSASATLHDVSERSLHRLCCVFFGYGPKALTQIHRFQRALQLAHTGMSSSATAVAAGYFDHAHFARECKRLTGRTPSELIPSAAGREAGRPVADSSKTDAAAGGRVADRRRFTAIISGDDAARRATGCAPFCHGERCPIVGAQPQ